MVANCLMTTDLDGDVKIIQDYTQLINRRKQNYMRVNPILMP